MAQNIQPKIVTDGLVYNLDTLGGRGPNKIITKPTQIDDCVLWLDAADESTVTGSGTNIYTWNDKSGNGNDAFNHGSEYPQYDGTTINGRKVVHFVATANSTGDVLKGAFAAGSQPFSGSTGGTIIIVFKQKSFVGTEFAAVLELAEGAYASSSYGDRLITNVFGSAYNSAEGYVNVVRMASGAGTTSHTARIENGAAIIMSYTNDGTTTTTYANGKKVGTASEDEADNARTHFCLGDDMTSGDHFNGYICEVIVFNRTITTNERQQVDLYLSRKWNIAIYTATRNQTTPNNLYSSNLPATGHKNGELFQVGNALYFKGGQNTLVSGSQADWINCGSVLGKGNTYNSGNNFTLEAWACSKSPTRDGSNWKTIIGSSSLAQINFYSTNTVYLIKNGGQPGGNALSSSSVTLHDWHHIVGTYNGEGLSQGFSGNRDTGPDRRQLYVDGQMVASDKESMYGGSIDNSFIASYHANGLERGPMELAVARIYNKELSRAEIQQNYNAQKARIDAIQKIAAPANLLVYVDAGLFESYRGTGSGPTFKDLSGNSRDGTISGATYASTLPENDMGKFFDFDGTDAYVTWGDITWLDGLTVVSVSCWFRLDGDPPNSAGMLVSKDNTLECVVKRSNSNEYSLSINNNHRVFSSAPTPAYNEWIHAVYTWNGTGDVRKLYLDGVLIDTDTGGNQSGNSLANSSDGLAMAARANGNYEIDGQMSNVMIYNIELSAYQVAQNFNYFKHRYGK